MRELNVDTKKKGSSYAAGTFVENAIHGLSHGDTLKQESINAFNRKPYDIYKKEENKNAGNNIGHKRVCIRKRESDEQGGV